MREAYRGRTRRQKARTSEVHTTRPAVLDDSPAALDALWDALALEPGEGAARGHAVRSHAARNHAIRIRAVMIASVDGTTTVDGLSGGLGTPTDRLVYDAMRARADVVLVGSGTALQESYGAAAVGRTWAHRRQRPAPPVVILSQTVPDELIELCLEGGDGMQIAAAATTPDKRVQAARQAGLSVHVMERGPYADGVRTMLAGLGAGEVAFEGGPHLLSEFLAHGLVDELILSVAPEIIVGGHGPGLTVSNGSSPQRIPARLAAAFSCPEGGLYTRWVVGDSEYRGDSEDCGDSGAVGASEKTDEETEASA